MTFGADVAGLLHAAEPLALLGIACVSSGAPKESCFPGSRSRSWSLAGACSCGIGAQAHVNRLDARRGEFSIVLDGRHGPRLVERGRHRAVAIRAVRYSPVVGVESHQAADVSLLLALASRADEPGAAARAT